MAKDSPDKLLFTPGPLTTSASVKSAAQHDYGSRDDAFIAIVREIRNQLVTLAGGAEETHTTVLMQGSGTFGIEATIGTAVPVDGKLLVAVNGAYGKRILTIADVLGIPVAAVEFPEHEAVDARLIAEAIEADRAITHVAACHVETTSGVLNPIEAIGSVCREYDRVFILDAMSSFGGMPLSVVDANVHFLVSSANKCIQGIPGFSVVVAQTKTLLDCAGQARSLSLDLVGQYNGLESNGQFRFTPPTHAILSFRQALDELDAEGGVAGRHARYTANYELVLARMTGLGFEPYLDASVATPIISSFRYPDDPSFDFNAFYEGLSEHGLLIYPGKVSDADCFRIGTIGDLDTDDMTRLCNAIPKVLDAMGVSLSPRVGS